MREDGAQKEVREKDPRRAGDTERREETALWETGSRTGAVFITLPRLTLSQKLMNNIPVCVSWSLSVCVYVCDEAEEVMGLATVYRAGPRLCRVRWDRERNRNDPERQDTQLYRRQNIKEATQLASASP